MFDWDQVGTPDKLGQAAVNLADLEPFQATERTLQLSGKGALEKSTVRVRLVFRPEFVASRGRKGTSLTFGAAGRTFTQGVGGIGRVGVGAGKGVVHGAGFVGKGAPISICYA